MKFKMIIALVPDGITDRIVSAAREAGATGSTVINNARGQGLKKTKTFLGLDLQGARDLVLFVVEQHLARGILETVARVGDFDAKPGNGVAFQIDLEDAVGLTSQIGTISSEIKDEI